jgi:hypothetical protein
MPAERIAIPQEAPQGTIQIASYGVTRLASGGANIPALHVRMIVSNDGDDVPWTIDSRKQMVEISGEGQSRAMYVNADVNTLPVLSIGRREHRTLDFYFPLPSTIHSDTGLHGFQVLWDVDTGTRAVASRTSFDRVSQAPSYAYAEPYGPYWAGYGPFWWYDPFYPSVVFVHARPFRFNHGGRVMVSGFSGHFRPGGRTVVGHRR